MATRSSALIMPTVRLSPGKLLSHSTRTLLRALEALPDNVEELLHRFGALNQFFPILPIDIIRILRMFPIYGGT